jgi:hypothetical protein
MARYANKLLDIGYIKGHGRRREASRGRGGRGTGGRREKHKR